MQLDRDPRGALLAAILKMAAGARIGSAQKQTSDPNNPYNIQYHYEPNFFPDFNKKEDPKGEWTHPGMYVVDPDVNGGEPTEVPAEVLQKDWKTHAEGDVLGKWEAHQGHGPASDPIVRALLRRGQRTEDDLAPFERALFARHLRGGTL